LLFIPNRYSFIADIVLQRYKISVDKTRETPFLFSKLGDFGLQTRRLWLANSATLVDKLGDFGQKRKRSRHVIKAWREQ